jgi:ribosome biogenesis GTPase
MSELTRPLAVLGWDERLAVAFEPHAKAGLVPGRVRLEHNHVYRVIGADREWLAEASGRIKYQATGRSALPAVGDWVALRPNETDGPALIRAILPRRTWFSRRAAGRRTDEQVVAANIDTVLVVFGLDRPVKRNAIDRYLVVAAASGAEPVVVLNKADLSADLPADLAEARAAAGAAPVFAVSATASPGVSVLEPFLKVGQTLALLGPSGSGKSTIVNQLLGSELLPTGEVREWDARGRHTSVHRQLVVRAAGGLIVDTPGMRELRLWDDDAPGHGTFADVEALSANCRFRDCQHDREPGCAIKAAVDSGALDAARYESLMKLQRERADLGQERTERARIDAERAARSGKSTRTRRDEKIVSKAIKSMQKERGR